MHHKRKFLQSCNYPAVLWLPVRSSWIWSFLQSSQDIFVSKELQTKCLSAFPPVVKCSGEGVPMFHIFRTPYLLLPASIYLLKPRERLKTLHVSVSETKVAQSCHKLDPQSYLSIFDEDCKV